MAYLETAEDQVRALALMARMALQLDLIAGVMGDGSLLVQTGEATMAWRIAPEHRHLLGGLPALEGSAQPESSHPSHVSASMEKSLPLSAAWMEETMGLLRAEAPAPSELFQMLDAVAVWRTFGKDSPRLAVDLHLKTQAMRNQFIGELASIKANDPHGGYDAVDARESARLCADEPVHLLVSAAQYQQLVRARYDEQPVQSH